MTPTEQWECVDVTLVTMLEGMKKERRSLRGLCGVFGHTFVVLCRIAAIEPNDVLDIVYEGEREHPAPYPDLRPKS